MIEEFALVVARFDCVGGWKLLSRWRGNIRDPFNICQFWHGISLAAGCTITIESFRALHSPNHITQFNYFIHTHVPVPWMWEIVWT
jgi:hypothetical protein